MKSFKVFILYLLLLILTLNLNANWKKSDKKIPEKTIEITQLETGESLRAYLWLPKNYSPTKQYKAVVMVHGCGGAHYKDDPTKWNAKYIAGKYKVWAKLLNNKNIIVLLVDSFTTRDNDDVGKGVCSSSDKSLDRPSKIDPISIRPGDIVSAIAYLKSRDDVDPNKVGVLGFSNGGTSVLVVANHESIQNRQNELKKHNKKVFNLPFIYDYKANVIISLYPGCGLNGYSNQTRYIFKNKFKTYTKTYIFMASDDTILPSNTKEKCNHLKELDPNLNLEEVENSDHQFDYYENNKPAVKKVIKKILNIFNNM